MQQYRITVRGSLGARWDSFVTGFDVEHGAHATTITGPVRDQSELRSLLDRLEELGLELVAIVPAGGADAADARPGGSGAAVPPSPPAVR